MGWDDLLIWFGGERFEVPMPQNTHRGNKTYDEKTPIFISAGSKMRMDPREAWTLQVNATEQNQMMDTRFNFFCHPIPAPGTYRRRVAPCRCFATWLRTPHSEGPFGNKHNQTKNALSDPSVSEVAMEKKRGTPGWSSFVSSLCFWQAPDVKKKGRVPTIGPTAKSCTPSQIT